MNGYLRLLKQDNFTFDTYPLLNKYSNIALTDLALLTGAKSFRDEQGIYGEYFVTVGPHEAMSIYDFRRNGTKFFDSFHTCNNYDRFYTIRPVLELDSTLIDSVLSNSFYGEDDICHVLYGEYPQQAPIREVQEALEQVYQNGILDETKHSYIFDDRRLDEGAFRFRPVFYKEYLYQDKKYIRLIAKPYKMRCTLSNGESYFDGEPVWLEVSPVEWLYNEKSHSFVSKNGLLSGIRYYPNTSTHTEFRKSELCQYMNCIMIANIFERPDKNLIEEEQPKFQPTTVVEDLNQAREQLQGIRTVYPVTTEAIDRVLSLLDRVESKVDTPPIKVKTL